MGCDPHPRRHEEGNCARLLPPETCLSWFWRGSAGTGGLKVCLRPVYTCFCLKAPQQELQRGGASPPRQGSRDPRGPEDLIPPCPVMEQGCSCGSFAAWDLGHPCPMAKRLRGSKAARACAPSQIPDVPRPRSRQTGLLIASRGALVCLSTLRQTHFAALIPIWK